MRDLLELFDELKNTYRLSIEIGYTPVLDWYIEIKKGNHAQYKILFQKQDCDLNICVSQAYLFLTGWVRKYQAGY